MKRLILTVGLAVLMGLMGETNYALAQDPWTDWAFHGSCGYGYYGYYGCYGDTDAAKMIAAGRLILDISRAVSSLEATHRSYELAEREQEYKHRQSQIVWSNQTTNPIIYNVEVKKTTDDGKDRTIKKLNSKIAELQIELKEKEQLLKRLRREKAELLKELKEGDKAKRKEAIAKLGGFLYDDEVRKALCAILLDPNEDPELRKEVAVSFGKVKNKKVLPALEKARVEDSDVEVRREADRAIRAIKG